MKLVKLLALALIACSTLSAVNSDKMYINEEELDFKQDTFRIHVGGNMWIETDTLHRDESGLYTFESRILKNVKLRNEYKKKWKCPYCYQYWDIGQACQNKDCPSRYK